MPKLDVSNKQQKSELEHVVGEVFSSEKREDIWAMIIAMGIFLLSVALPSQIYHFFNQVRSGNLPLRLREKVSRQISIISIKGTDPLLAK